MLGVFLSEALTRRHQKYFQLYHYCATITLLLLDHHLRRRYLPCINTTSPVKIIIIITPIFAPGLVENTIGSHGEVFVTIPSSK